MSRFLKVRSYLRFSAYIGRHYSPPEIILKGKWLEKAGFGHGDTVKVIVHQNTITLTKA